MPPSSWVLRHASHASPSGSWLSSSTALIRPTSSISPSSLTSYSMKSIRTVWLPARWESLARRSAGVSSSRLGDAQVLFARGPDGERIVCVGETERQNLADALDRLDEVFRQVEIPSDIDGCTYCWPNGWEELLLPADEVPYDSIVSYSMEGEDHWTPYAPILRHLFPRIARLLGEGHLHVHAGRVLSHLRGAEWQQRAPAERDAVEEFFDAIYRKTLSEDPSGDLDGNEILCGVAAATWDIVPWLSVWDEMPPEHAARHLPKLIRMRPLVRSRSQWYQAARDERLEGWWPRGSAVPLRAWLSRPIIEEQLFELLGADPDPRIEEAIHALELLRIPEDEEGLSILRFQNGRAVLRRHVGMWVDRHEKRVTADPQNWSSEDGHRPHLATLAKAVATHLVEFGSLRSDLTPDQAADIFFVVGVEPTYRALREDRERSEQECRELLAKMLEHALLEEIGRS